MLQSMRSQRDVTRQLNNNNADSQGDNSTLNLKKKKQYKYSFDHITVTKIKTVSGHTLGQSGYQH